MLEIAKHYRKEIGIRIASVAEVLDGSYSISNTEEAREIGVMSDFIVSPSLSVESGFVYQRSRYEMMPEALDQLDLSPTDGQPGEFSYFGSTSERSEIPVNLKYRYPLNNRFNVIGSAGLSGLFYLDQDFEYVYHFTVSNGLSFPIGSAFRTREPKIHPGAVNTSPGIQHKLKKNNKLPEAYVFYQHALEEVGIEGIKGNFFGIRGAYGFTLKE